MLQKRDERYQRDSQTHKSKTTDNAMAKNEKDKQTTANTTQHRKLKNKQHEPHRGEIETKTEHYEGSCSKTTDT